MEKIPMTAAGFKGLEDELNQLKNVDRHEIIKAMPVTQNRVLTYSPA